MRAELLKLRALPTPRWCLGICLLCAVIALVITAFAGVGSDEDVASGLGVELPTAVGSIVLGAWIVGLEYGSGTMRRTLTADPRRARVFGAKLAVALLSALALTFVCFAVFAIAFPIVAGDETSRAFGDFAEIFAAAIPGNLVAAFAAAAIALLTRSMAGGVTAAFLFIFVLDTAVSAIPDVGDYTLGAAQLDIYEAIRGMEDPDLWRAILASIAWMAGLSGVSLARFARSDV